MIKIRDRIILGVISGILAGTPDTLLNLIEYRNKLTNMTYAGMGANIFLPRKKIGSPAGRVTGYLANYTAISGAGILFTYLLTLTGKKRALLKGIGMGLTSWIAVYGLGAKLALSVRSRKPMAPLLSFFDHLLFGSLLGFITPRLAHESLFPEGQTIYYNEKPNSEVEDSERGNSLLIN